MALVRGSEVMNLIVYKGSFHQGKTLYETSLIIDT